MNTYKANKFDGRCGCGTAVEAGTGFYTYGMIFCAAPNDLNHCPTYQAQCDALEAQRTQAQQKWWETMTPEQRSTFSGYTANADGTCGKCGGNGKYLFATGTIGICYQCDGTGKEQPR